MHSCYKYNNAHDYCGYDCTTTYAIWATKLWVDSRPWQGVLNTTLCDKVCQWFVASLVSSINKIDRYNITGKLLKIMFNTHNPDLYNNPQDKIHTNDAKCTPSTCWWKPAPCPFITSLIPVNPSLKQQMSPLITCSRRLFFY